jgi:amino-acid N-acetyltransferase
MLVELTYGRQPVGSRPSAPRAPGPIDRTRNGQVPESPSPAGDSGRDRAVLALVRPAEIRDMRAVAPLVNRFAEWNLMLAKSDDQLMRAFREFLVAVDEEDKLVGCGALRIYSEELAEIVSLAVDESYQGSGVGRDIVEGLVAEARALGIRSVFALTLRESFFHRLGFATVPKELFPLKVWADCRSCPKLHACDEIAVVKQLA